MRSKWLNRLRFSKARTAKTRQLTLSLAEEMLRLGGADLSFAAEKLDDGSASLFEEIIEAQGGDLGSVPICLAYPFKYREPILRSPPVSYKGWTLD